MNHESLNDAVATYTTTHVRTDFRLQQSMKYPCEAIVDGPGSTQHCKDFSTIPKETRTKLSFHTSEVLLAQQNTSMFGDNVLSLIGVQSIHV